ncbi:TonB-dependent receptor domain-containing protein [Pseudomonas arabinosi]|uniref:TonB-dependent receptor domain-containing protein n=1 Tax=Pseudomonas arabinosi TaxID=3398357 RepID=UPI003D80ABA1
MINETDFQTGFGARGDDIGIGGWAWDLSSTYGRNYAKQRNYDNQNPSLGENTPNKFTSGIYIADQWTINLDLKNNYDIGLAKPLDVAFGFEHRRDSYETRAGSEASYIDGGYVFPAGHPRAGQRPDPGAQITNGITPDDAQKVSRNNVASYIDLGFYPLEQWYLGVAARYEHYNEGVGSTRSGKISSRYEFNPVFSIRGTISNGFRAPSLANESSPRVRPGSTINGVYQSYNYVILPVDTAGVQALGAESLKPERSTNFSLGFLALEPKAEAVAFPVQNLHPVARLVEENEKYGVEHGDLDIQLDQRSQTINGFSEVDRFGIEIHFFDFGVGSHHGELAPERNREHSFGDEVSALNVGLMERLRRNSRP